MAWLEAQIRNSSLLYPMVQKYQALSKREQTLVGVMSLVIFLYLIYSSLWLPIHERQEAAQKKLDANLKTYYLLVENAALLNANQADQGIVLEDRSGQALQALVSRTMRKQKLVAQRMNLDGDSRLQVWVENTSYSEISKWLEVLAKNKVAIFSVQFASRDLGIVDMRLTLD
ncbi:MAG: type II secretion system protein GspM [Marinomonas sp.]|jgi:general secretion pathway protein M